MITTKTKDTINAVAVPSERLMRLLNVSRKTLCRWCDAGILRPAGHGRYLFDELDLLTAAVAVDLRGRNFSVPQCQVVAGWLQSKGMDALKSEWATGRRYILSIGSQPLFHRQFDFDEVFLNEAVDLPAAFEAKLPLAIVDLEKAFYELCRKLQDGGLE